MVKNILLYITFLLFMIGMYIYLGDYSYFLFTVFSIASLLAFTCSLFYSRKK